MTNKSKRKRRAAQSKPHFLHLNDVINTAGYMGDFEEYEVRVEREFNGVLQFGAFELKRWDQEVLQGERSLIVRAPRQWRGLGDFGKENQIAFTGLLPVEELVDLVAVYFGARMRVGQVTRAGDRPYRAHTRRDLRSTVPKSSVAKLADATNFISSFATLQPEYQKAVIIASKCYVNSLFAARRDYESAFLWLVNALECLASVAAINEHRTDWLGDEPRKFLQMVKVKNKDEAEAWLLRNSSIRQKVLNFCFEYTPKTFFKRKTNPTAKMITKSNLRQVIDNLYKARSGFLHSGTPFPAYLAERGEVFGSELPTAMAVQSGDAKWEAKDFVPYYFALERLTRALIRSVIERHQA